MVSASATLRERMDRPRSTADYGRRAGAVPPRSESQPATDRRAKPPRPVVDEHGARGPTEDDDFALLVRPLLAELVRLARRRLGCDHLAWEVVQEALFSLWSQPTPPPNPKAWLIRAVLYRSLHLRRTIHRRHRHEGMACLIRPENDDRDDPSLRFVAEELRAEVRSAVEKLDRKHRDVLILNLVEGLDYLSISLRLGIPIGTVRSRLSRARQALRLHLSSDPRGPS